MNNLLNLQNVVFEAEVKHPMATLKCYKQGYTYAAVSGLYCRYN